MIGTIIFWWVVGSICATPFIIGLCKAAGDADERLGYKS